MIVNLVILRLGVHRYRRAFVAFLISTEARLPGRSSKLERESGFPMDDGVGFGLGRILVIYHGVV